MTVFHAADEYGRPRNRAITVVSRKVALVGTSDELDQWPRTDVAESGRIGRVVTRRPTAGRCSSRSTAIDDLDMMWGDVGTLYWLARTGDPANDDPTAISFTWQCC